MSVARRRAHCHVCERSSRRADRVPEPTAQRYIGPDRGEGRRPAELYACDACDTILLSLADVYDAEGFVLAFESAWWAGASPDDRDEWLAKATEWLWKAYTRWDPARSVRFRPYAWTFLRNRATDDVRSRLGRVVDGELRPRNAVTIGGERVAVEVESLDALRESRGQDPVAGADGGRSGDPARDRSPDLARAVRG